MDNLGSHKSAEVRRMIRTVGARLWYLPPYSPDLNPIEQAFAKIKHWMRAAQKRTVEDLWRHIASLISTIEARECSNYFANAGCASIKPRNALRARKPPARRNRNGGSGSYPKRMSPSR
jgi:hypothetical protein